MSREPETDEVRVTVLDEAPASYLLRCRGLTASFPKSQVSFKRRNVKTGEAVAEIPVWLLKDRGWDKPGTGSAAAGMPDETEEELCKNCGRFEHLGDC